MTPLTHLRSLDEAEEELLRSVCDEAIREIGAGWQAALDRREIFWVNLWQRSGEGRRFGVARIDELDGWARRIVEAHYERDGATLDGYGILVNPIGSRTQAWHLDYSSDDSTVFVALSRVTPENAMQVLVVPPAIAPEVYARATADPERVDVEDILRNAEGAAIEKLLPEPGSIDKLDFGAIHRGVSNTADFHRVGFWISVKRGGALLPAEPLVADFGEG